MTWVYFAVFRIGVFVLLGMRLSRGVVWAWLPEAVLNQSQVILVVSDWEPYLGSLVSLCISWVIVPVSV